MTPKAISFYELEQREPPENILIAISKMFNASIDYLLSRDELNNMSSIGMRIKEARKSVYLTQQELAQKTNLSRSYISDLEKDRYNPSISTLKLIAKATRCELEALISDTSYLNNHDGVKIPLLNTNDIKQKNDLSEETDLLGICSHLSYETISEGIAPDKYISADELRLSTMRYTQLLILMTIKFLVDTWQFDKLQKFESQVNKYYYEPFPLSLIRLSYQISARIDIVVIDPDRELTTLEFDEYLSSIIANNIFPSTYCEHADYLYATIILPNLCNTINQLWEAIHDRPTL